MLISLSKASEPMDGPTKSVVHGQSDTRPMVTFRDYAQPAEPGVALTIRRYDHT